MPIFPAVDESGSIISQKVRDRLDESAGQVARWWAEVKSGVVSVADHGAKPDYNGTTGTDSAAAFNAAIAAVGEGGTVDVPPGRYFLGSTVVMNKSIHLRCGAGGYRDKAIGTELTFAPGVSGIRVEQGTAVTPPTKWTIGPFNIRSKSTTPGADVGIFVSAGRGEIGPVTVDGFGSHGIHLLGGVGYGDGKGNANNTVLQSVRAYGNRGDGIRCEGTDANAILMMKPDVVANHGWGINMEKAAISVIMAAHADQQYNGSPGAFRDNGNSNSWDWVYSEGQKPFLIDTNSSYGRLAVSLYAAPIIQTNGNGHLSWRISGADGSNTMRMKGVTALDTKAWQFSTSKASGDSWDFWQVTDNLKVLSVNGSVTTTTHYTNQLPDTTMTRDLGTSTRSWRDAYVGSVRFGDTGALPTATAALRGQTRVVRGAAGVADALYVCIKNAADAYEWKQIA